MRVRARPHLLRAATLLAAFFSLVACVAGVPLEDAPGSTGVPWQRGDEVAGQRVARVLVHPEYVRLSFDDGRTGVEINACDNDCGPFGSRLYRVQPAPAATAPEELLSAVVAELVEREARPGHLPLVGGQATAIATGRLDLSSWMWFAGLHLALAFVLLLLFQRVTRAEPHARRAVAAEAAILVAASIGYFVGFTPRDVPLAWLVPLHEGGSRMVIDQVLGAFTNAGPNFSFVKSLFAPPGPGALFAVVWMNIWLTGVFAFLFFALARRVVGWGWAVLLMAAVALTPAAAHMALSELPAAASGVYLMLAAIAATAARGRTPHRGWFDGLLVVAALALSSALLAGLRPDFGVPAGLAAVVTGAWVFAPSHMATAFPRALAWVRRRRFTAAALALCVVALLVVLELLPGLLPYGRAQWIARAIRPLNPMWVQMPYLFLAMARPLLVLLVFAGLVASLARPLRTLLFPISVLLLYFLYHAGELDSLKPFRFMVLMTPMLALVGLIGLQAVRVALANVLVRSVGRWVVAGLAAILLLVPMLPQGLRFVQWHQRPELPTLGELFDGDNQRAARFLAAGLRDHPECVVAAVVTPGYQGVERGGECAYLLFGGPLPRPYLEPIRGRAPAAAARRYAAGAPCGLLYAGLDTNLVRAECKADAGASNALEGCCVPNGLLPAVREESFARRPSSSDMTCGALESTIRIGLYRLWGLKLPEASAQPPVGGEE